jgi:hypothetical protein
MWPGARPPLEPIPQPRPQQQPSEAPAPAPTAGADQWAPPGFYHPMAGLPSWDTQSLASAFSTTTLQQPPTNEWYFDSGATSHMRSSSSSLSHFSFPWYPTPSSIVVGDGSLLPVVGTGSTELPHSLFLNNILVSPQIIRNLISVH